MTVDNYRVVHAIHLLPPIKPRSMNGVVPRFKDLDESPINEPNTTLELKHLLGKNCVLLLCRNPSLGLATKARGCKVAGQKGDSGACHMPPGMQRV